MLSDDSVDSVDARALCRPGGRFESEDFWVSETQGQPPISAHMGGRFSDV